MSSNRFSKVYALPYLRPRRESIEVKEHLSTDEVAKLVHDVISDISSKSGGEQIDALYKIVLGRESHHQEKDEKLTEIKKTIDDIASEKGKELLVAMYSQFYTITEESFAIEDIDITDKVAVLRLGNFSRRKLINHHLKQKYPSITARKKAIYDINKANELLQTDDLSALKLDPIVGYIHGVFGNSSDFSFSEYLMRFAYECSPDEQIELLNILKDSGASASVIEKFEAEIGKSSEDHLMNGNHPVQINSEVSPNLTAVQSKLRSGNSDFNPFTLELDIETGFKLFSEARFKELYLKTFFGITKNILADTGGILPRTNNFVHLNKRKLQEKNSSPEGKNEEKFICQQILEWEIDADFDEKKLLEVVHLMREEGFGINTIPGNEAKALKYPRTRDGLLKYKGHTSQSGGTRIEDHVIIVEDQVTGARDLRVGLSSLTQDDYIYVSTQISHYLEHGTFIDKNQLFTRIYHEYNLNSYGENESFDISIHKKQYDAFMRKVVLPHTSIGAEEGLKSDHVLLAGLYGSGKSQFLLKLLTERVFEYNSKKFELNSNVIAIDLLTFKTMLVSNIGGFRTRLDQIYQNTGLPIILIVEDADTLVNEKLTGGNDEIAQAMTLLLEGIGSIPVTVVTSSNDPKKFSERLVRPNRLYEIIEFYKGSEKENYAILDQHLHKSEITLSEEVRAKLTETNVFKHGTASHIAKFVDELSAHISVHKIFHGDRKLPSDEEILEIANNVNVSVDDINMTIESIREWVKQVTGKKQQSPGYGCKFTSGKKD